MGIRLVTEAEINKQNGLHATALVMACSGDGERLLPLGWIRMHKFLCVC